MDHDIRHEYQLQQRLAALEARIAWLEDALARVLGEPGNPVSPSTLAAAPELDRYMLRTRPMDSLAWATLERNVRGALATLGNEHAAGEPPMPTRRSSDIRSRELLRQTPPKGMPVLKSTIESASPFLHPPKAGGSNTARFDPADIAPDPEVDMLAELQPRSFDTPATAPAAAPAPAPVAPAPAKPAKDSLNLGFTAAFETLASKVAEAADAELEAGRKPGGDAPMLDLTDDMLDTSVMRPQMHLLQVRCALELQMPSVLQQLINGWRKPESVELIKKLIQDDYGRRVVLDPAIKEELLLLSAVHATPAA